MERVGAKCGTLIVIGAVWAWLVGRFATFPEFPKTKNEKRKSLEPILLAPGSANAAWVGSGGHLRLAALVASTWTALEWARGYLLPAWNQAGIPVSDNLALLQLTKVVGPAGLSFIVVFANTIILANVRRFILQPGRMNWAGRFDVTATLAVLLLVAAAGFWSLRSAPEPKGLKVCAVSSTATDFDRLTDLSLVAPATHCDLVIWRRTQLHSGDYQVLTKASLGQSIALIAGTAVSPDAPLTGYTVFGPRISPKRICRCFVSAFSADGWPADCATISQSPVKMPSCSLFWGTTPARLNLSGPPSRNKFNASSYWLINRRRSQPKKSN